MDVDHTCDQLWDSSSQLPPWCWSPGSGWHEVGCPLLPLFVEGTVQSTVLVYPESADDHWLLPLPLAVEGLWRKLVRQVEIDHPGSGRAHGELIVLLGELGAYAPGEADRVLSVIEQWCAVILRPPRDQVVDRVCRQVAQDAGFVAAARDERCTTAWVRDALEQSFVSIRSGGDAVSAERRRQWASQLLDAFDGAWSRADTPGGP